MRCASRTSSWPFIVLGADVQQADGRACATPWTARWKASPMMANSTSCSASQSTLAPTSSTVVTPRGGRPAGDQGRPVQVGAHPQDQLEIAIRAPVLPAETAARASPVASPPRRRSTSRCPCRGAWPGRAWRRKRSRPVIREPSIRGSSGSFEASAMAAESSVKNESHVAQPLQAGRERGNDDRRTVVAAHRVDRDYQPIGHVSARPSLSADPSDPNRPNDTGHDA